MKIRSLFPILALLISAVVFANEPKLPLVPSLPQSACDQILQNKPSNYIQISDLIPGKFDIQEHLFVSTSMDRKPILDEFKDLVAKLYSEGDVVWWFSQGHFNRPNGQKEYLPQLHVKGRTTALDLKILIAGLADLKKDLSITQKLSVGREGGTGISLSPKVYISSRLMTSRGHLAKGRYISMSTPSEYLRRSLREGYVVAKDAKAFVLANKEQFFPETINKFESHSLEDLAEMWHNGGFNIPMKDSGKLRVIYLTGMRKAKEHFPEIVTERLAEEGLSDVRVFFPKSLMGNELFYLEFDITQFPKLIKLTEGDQPLLDQVGIDEWVEPRN